MSEYIPGGRKYGLRPTYTPGGRIVDKRDEALLLPGLPSRVIQMKMEPQLWPLTYI